jgi:mannobiose 2-epimerase
MSQLHQPKGLLSQRLERETHHIADWWILNSIDRVAGGFYGEISDKQVANLSANKGIILNTRILWFFSAAAQRYGLPAYREMADRAYEYLLTSFDDKVYGGVVWELDSSGHSVNNKKQIYAQSFAIYGLSAYYQATENEDALLKAMSYFDLIEKHAIEPITGGYLEAFTGNWSLLDDVRLSGKDQNAPKTMNTHIHILEAYTCLYRATRHTKVALALEKLIHLICQKILNTDSYHLHLFMTMDWQDLSESYSYGHDIECSWLLYDAIEALNLQKLSDAYIPMVVKMATTCLKQSIGDEGQVCDQFTFKDSTKHNDSFWWVQAESLVGFLNAYQLTGDKAFIRACEKIWKFTQDQHIDGQYGEWTWSAKRDAHSTAPDYKAGFWKGPYHNGRAMMEAADLLLKIEQQTDVKKHAKVN